MCIKINLSSFFPDWNSRIVDKVWHFRDILTFLFGELGGWKERHYAESEQTMLISFDAAEDAQRAIDCLNNREGVRASLV